MQEKEKKILDVAQYIIDNKATIKETAEHFKMSESSIKKYINDYDKLINIDEAKYLAVKYVQSEIELKGQRKGAEIGKRGKAIDERKIIEIAKKMITNGWTLQIASSYYNMPTSTIYDRVTDIKDENLRRSIYELFEDNSKNRGGRQ
ncbi:MAG: hypothetical protein E7158_04340 [Firmicutes bacterium]|nr:hypothetical protein [Bacillota bacterium]